jgi:hypothetical protein
VAVTRQSEKTGGGGDVRGQAEGVKRGKGEG